jgi:hypothetical protein
MAKRKTKIMFDMADEADISDEIVGVNKDFYTKRTTSSCGSLRFPIPTPIKIELDLQPSDICYFCSYSEGFYISFKIKPETATKAQVRSRKLSVAGNNNTLYVCIPPFIKNLYREPITSVELIRTEGFQPYEWHIKFHSIDCT